MNNVLLETDMYSKTPLIKKEADLQKMRKSAEDFEAFFISQMYQHMFEGIDTNGMFGGGNAEKMWRSMLIDEYGKMTVKNGGIGIADNVMKFMLKAQEV